MPISQGKFFRIEGFNGADPINRRLEEMGLFKGAEIEIRGRLPFRGPWIISLGATAFALRDDEAALLQVQEIK